jgi:hypothetical protein
MIKLMLCRRKKTHQATKTIASPPTRMANLSWEMDGLKEQGLPVLHWQPMQLQAMVNNGAADTKKRTCLYWHLPSLWIVPGVSHCSLRATGARVVN